MGHGLFSSLLHLASARGLLTIFPVGFSNTYQLETEVNYLSMCNIKVVNNIEFHTIMQKMQPSEIIYSLMLYFFIDDDKHFHTHPCYFTILFK